MRCCSGRADFTAIKAIKAVKAIKALSERLEQENCGEKTEARRWLQLRSGSEPCEWPEIAIEAIQHKDVVGCAIVKVLAPDVLARDILWAAHHIPSSSPPDISRSPPPEPDTNKRGRGGGATSSGPAVVYLPSGSAAHLSLSPVLSPCLSAAPSPPCTLLHIAVSQNALQTVDAILGRRDSPTVTASLLTRKDGAGSRVVVNASKTARGVVVGRRGSLVFLHSICSPNDHFQIAFFPNVSKDPVFHSAIHRVSWS